MNKRFIPLPFVAIAAGLLAFASTVGAQESPTTGQTTVTTTIPGQPTPVPTTSTTIQVQPIAPVQPVQPVAPVGGAVTTTNTVTLGPGQHLVEIELAVSRGKLQAYFGRAARGENVKIGAVDLSFKLPSSATVEKIVSRDDDSPGSHKITPDNPWSVSLPFTGGGRFVFNISDWDDDAIVTAALVKVDGVVMFAGHGSEDDFNGWVEKTYGPGVRKTGSREVAFVLPHDRE